ncbi:hypothetical protein F511_04247 [Dorcoceras hygrometricum]|nr:hypothetical protein F511_04247 [Dorcoceras hygrometricum]
MKSKLKKRLVVKADAVSSDDLQTALSKLKTENDDLRSRSQDMIDENLCLAEIISSWTKSSGSLQRLHGAMEPSSNKIGLGYETDESNVAETSTHPKMDKPKLQTINFVKSSLGQPEEYKSDESQIAGKHHIWHGRYCGVVYTAP